MGSSYKLTGRLDGTLTISGTPAQGRTVTELESAIRNEITDLQTNLVTEAELQRVKAQVVSSDVYERDSAFYQGMILGIFETVGLGWQRADDYVEGVAAVTADQVQAMARKYLVDEGATLAVLQPAAMTRPTNETQGAEK